MIQLLVIGDNYDLSRSLIINQTQKSDKYSMVALFQPFTFNPLAPKHWIYKTAGHWGQRPMVWDKSILNMLCI